MNKKTNIIWVHDPIKDILGLPVKKECKTHGCVVDHSCTCNGGNGFTCDSSFKLNLN